MPRKNGARRAQPQERRVCKCCSHTKPIELFKKVGNGYSGHTCKQCDAARTRKRRRADPEKYRARSRARAKTARGRAINKAAVCRYEKRHPERVRARQAVHSAVKRGDIIVPSVCQVLGCSKNEDLHLHHPSYERPLDVIAACRGHHEHLHHRGPFELKPSAGRKWARKPRTSAITPG